MAVNGINSSSLRMAGLASGLDTETLVKQMSSLSKTRLNLQQQKLDKLSWKQESYRDVISKISEFKDTYFNTLKPATNLSSKTLFGTRSATSTNSLISVSASSNATETTYNISEVIKQAKSASIESTAKPIEGINLDFSTATSGTDYTVKFSLDGLAKNITFAGGADADATKNNFLNALNNEFASTNVTFAMTDNRLTTTDSVYSDLLHTYTIEATSIGSTPELTAMGLSDKATSKTSTSKTLDQLAFSTKLQGNGFSFEINGEKFNFSKSSTLQNVMDTVNNSKAGVRISFDSLSGGFSLKSSEMGDGSKLEISQTSGNLLSSLFGSDKIAPSTAVSSSSLISNGISGITPNDGDGFGFADGVTGDISALINKKISVTVNGTTKEIGFWNYNSSGTKNDFSKSENVINQLNSELSKNFGTTAPQFSYDKTEKAFTLTTAKTGDVVSLASVTDASGGSDKLVSALGFNATNSTNAIDTSTKLFEGMSGSGITANISFGTGFVVHLDENSTIGDLVNGSNGNMSFENGMLTLKGVDFNGANTDDAGRTYLESIFGKGYNYPGIPPTGIVTNYTSNGENAIIKVNGVNITNSSSNFTIDGTSFDISGLKTGMVDATITTAKDTSKAMDAVKGFVKDYNTLIDSLNKETKTAYDSDYPPLTDEQREEMSDKEIENWEKKAKIGLLYQDQTINKVLSTTRSAVNSRVSAGFSLYDMGIKTSSNFLDNGKLELDEAKLTRIFNENPDEIQNFFTNAVEGFATKVNAVLDSAVKTTGATKGSLVLLAGVSNTSTDVDNTISNQLKSYKAVIDTLQTKYENEQDRYWKQFTNLEKMMSAYNSQSEWLTSQFT